MHEKLNKRERKKIMNSKYSPGLVLPPIISLKFLNSPFTGTVARDFCVDFFHQTVPPGPISRAGHIAL